MADGDFKTPFCFFLVSVGIYHQLLAHGPAAHEGLGEKVDGCSGRVHYWVDSNILNAGLLQAAVWATDPASAKYCLLPSQHTCPSPTNAMRCALQQNTRHSYSDSLQAFCWYGIGSLRFAMS